MTAVLGDLLSEIRSGFASGGDEPGGVVQFRMNNVDRVGQINWDKVRRVPQAKAKETLLLRHGDILFNATNSPELVGKTALFAGFSEPVTFSNHFFRMRVKASLAEPAFLTRWLQHQFEQGRFTAMCKSWVNQASVSKDQLLALSVRLPPLPEQRRIAAILDKADALRRKRKRAIELLDSLTQSIFLEMFGDSEQVNTVPLGQLIDEGDRINYGVVQPGDDVAEGVHLVRVSDLSAGRVEHSLLRKVSVSVSEKHARSILKGHEILISCVGSIGEIAVATERERGLNIARAIARVPILDDQVRDYVAEYLRSPTVKQYFTKELRTVSQPTLNIKQISETEIPLPSRAQLIQHQKIQRKMEKCVRGAFSQSARLEGLFSSLQHRAFSGQL